MSRFSYAISPQADQIIEAEMKTYGRTKNSAINTLIERIPAQKTVIERQEKRIKEMEEYRLELHKQIEKLVKDQSSKEAQMKALRELFGLDKIESLVLELKRVMEEPTAKKPAKEPAAS
jgi:cell shape-determining protein MreC